MCYIFLDEEIDRKPADINATFLQSCIISKSTIEECGSLQVDWLTYTVGQKTKGSPSKQQCAADGRIEATTHFQDLSNGLLPLEFVHCVQLHRNVWYEAWGMGRWASIWFKPTCWHVVAERSARNCWSNSFERGKRCPSGWEVWGKQAQAWQDGISKYLGGALCSHGNVFGVFVFWSG